MTLKSPLLDHSAVQSNQKGLRKKTETENCRPHVQFLYERLKPKFHFKVSTLEKDKLLELPTLVRVQFLRRLKIRKHFSFSVWELCSLIFSFTQSSLYSVYCLLKLIRIIKIKKLSFYCRRYNFLWTKLKLNYR